MPPYVASSLLKLASLALVLLVCFIAGFFFAPNANAQSYCPGGTIGSCTDLRFEYSSCRYGCCGNPPPGQLGCCTFITYYCTEPVSEAGLPLRVRL